MRRKKIIDNRYGHEDTTLMRHGRGGHSLSYTTRKRALGSANDAIQKGLDPDLRFTVYHCYRCHAFHIRELPGGHYTARRNAQALARLDALLAEQEAHHAA